MIDTRASKRRLSDADKNERITLRQMVLNMSMCKLQKHNGRKEPSLLRSVIINNTVQQIEREMDDELLAEYENRQYRYNNEDIHMHADDFFSPSYPDKEQPSLHKQPTVNTQISFTREETPSADAKKENKFGAIGDHRKNSLPESNTPSKPMGYLSGFMWDSLSLPSLNTTGGPILESVEIGNNFTDVDISLYDFDNNFIAANLQQSLNNGWQPFPKSCAVEYDSRKPDSFFQELDQIMQVLVGM